MEKTKILIIEDQPADAELMVFEMKRQGLSFEWKRIDRVEEFNESLDKNYDVILSDYSVPNFNTMEALREAKTRLPDIPFIVVTGSLGEEQAVSVIKEGAWDYLKDQLARIGIVVRGAITQSQQLQEKRKLDQSRAESEQILRLVVDNVDEALWMATCPDLEKHYINSACETIWGPKCQKLDRDPMSWIQAVHPDDRSRVLEAYKTGAENGAYREEYRVIDGTGQIRWISEQVTPVKNEREEIYRLVGIAKDISEYRSTV